MLKYRLGVVLLVFLSVSIGCHAVSPQLRKEAADSPPFSEILRNPTSYVGKTVIWGGQIVQTINQSTGTSLIVLETPLGYGEMPKSPVHSQGRFIARTDKYLDPAVYTKDRMVTVAGEVTGKEVLPIDQIQYTYPVVRIKEIKLWQPYSYYPYHYYPYYHYPYWDGCGWGCPWGW